MLRLLIHSSPAVNVFLKSPRRWLSLVISLVIHASVALLLLSTGRSIPSEVARYPEYKVILIPIRPKDPHTKEKLVWNVIPEIAPLHRFGPEDTPHAEKNPLKQVLIAQSKMPDSKKQLVQEAEHPLPLPVDVPTPNLVAVQAEKPPEPKLTPKVFVPPPPLPAPVRKPDQHVAVLDVLPSLLPSKEATRNDLQQFLTPVARMKFKPSASPVAVQQSKVAEISPMRDLPNLPPAPGSASHQIPGLQAVIVSLNPGVGPPPQGSRSAQFARAPDAGIPSSGVIAQPGAVTVPGLIAHGKPAMPMKPPTVQPSVSGSRRQVVKEVEIDGFNRTMSAPLRPSSRIIPLSVEGQFAKRDVYTLVIPGPDLPGYKEDWVMWFSERQPSDDPRQRISAPVPLRKYATLEELTGTPTTALVQFAAVLDKKGRVASVKVIKCRADPEFKLRAMQELEAWDFKPALRNGEPIEVDIVLEIPMQLKINADTQNK